MADDPTEEKKLPDADELESAVWEEFVLACYLLACRSRQYERVATIAVTAKGKALFEDLGWERHNYREHGSPRSLFWIDTGEQTAQRLKQRLRLDDSVQSSCFRAGATERSRDKRYARC